ncbi:hypothetical protein [Parasutterella muris]|uniref:Uncharacterized protein n=3 Tax=Parasutterella TaxID=577310 RepID=A0A6L6YGX7_9BURK|nr:hypothetical protein [Parasutterella muris]MVX55928.1 hypothetical protein [Parasutterella muris]
MGLFSKTDASITLTGSKSNRKIVVDSNMLAPIPTEEIVRKLKLHDYAREEGKKNLPPSDAKVPGGTEQTLFQEYQQIVTRYQQYTTNILSAYNGRLQEALSLFNDFYSKVQVLPTQFRSELKSEAAKLQVEIHKARDDVEKATRHYYNFRSENGLNRPASLNTVLQKFIKILFLVLLVVVESVANASLFSKNLESGLVGGMMYAILFAALNATVCFMVAKAMITRIVHIKMSQKLFGFCSLIFLIGFLILFGLFVGHYRDALQVTEENASLIGLQTFLQNPIKLGDMISYLLLALTFVMGSLAAIDGFCFIDPYPGYAQEEERYREACDEWTEFYEETNKQLEGIYQKSLDGLNVSVSDAQAEHAVIMNTTQEREQLLLRYQTCYKNSSASCQAALGIYRKENQLSRTTPTPAYFDDYSIFEQPLPPVITGNGWDGDIENIIKVGIAKAEEVEKKLQELRQNQPDVAREIIEVFNQTKVEIGLNNPSISNLYADVESVKQDISSNIYAGNSVDYEGA